MKKSLYFLTLAFCLITFLIAGFTPQKIYAAQDSGDTIHFAAWKSGDQATTCEAGGKKEEVPASSYIGCMAVTVKADYQKSGRKSTLNTIEITITPYGYHYNGEKWNKDDVTGITVEEVMVGLNGVSGENIEWSDKTAWKVNGETGKVTKKFTVNKPLLARQAIVWVKFKIDGVALESKGLTNWIASYNITTNNINVANLDEASTLPVKCPYCEFNKHSVCP
ncbi:MAG: hypothetical protein ABRQ37_20770 [Candidatus Eremiobacterota bacterium]